MSSVSAVLVAVRESMARLIAASVETSGPGWAASIRNVRAASRVSACRDQEKLTIGEYERLGELPTRWDRLGWALDRTVFLGALDEVRMCAARS